jgi:hypothetical protein
LIEQSARAVPAGLAASAASAALGSSAAVSSYAMHLAAQLLKQAGRAKLLASLTGVAMLLALVLSALAMNSTGRRPVASIAPGLPAALESRAAPGDAADIDALWKTLARAELALRNMDTPALSDAVAFTNPQQADNWAVMARVFAADQRLKQAASAKFGPDGAGLTSIQTFGQRLDQILPLVDQRSFAWVVHENDAALHFAYSDAQTQGGALLFIKIDGQWKIDAGRSVDVALEGLGSNMLRVAVQDLNPTERAGVIQRMEQMEQVLDDTARHIEGDPSYDLAAARYALQKIDSTAGSRAFFHLALRLDNQEQPRE